VNKRIFFILVLSSLVAVIGCGTPSTRGFSDPCREAKRTISREEETSATSMVCEGNAVILTYATEKHTLLLKHYRNITGGYGVEEARPILSLEYVAAKKEEEPIAAKIAKFDFSWGYDHELVVQRRRIYQPPKLAGVARWHDEYQVLSVKKKEPASPDRCFTWVLNENAVMRLHQDKKKFVDFWKALDPRKTLRCEKDRLCSKLDWLTEANKAPIHLKVCAGNRVKDPLTITSVKRPAAS
jgi:hypothetical protein